MLIVQKYGGTSVGTPERLRAVARRVAAARARGHELVVVVSAMGDTTDDLLALAAEVTGDEAPRAQPPARDGHAAHRGRADLHGAAGDGDPRRQGAEAVSLTGSQAAIITDEAHTAARIREVRADRVREALERGARW